MATSYDEPPSFDSKTFIEDKKMFDEHLIQYSHDPRKYNEDLVDKFKPFAERFLALSFPAQTRKDNIGIFIVDWYIKINIIKENDYTNFDSYYFLLLANIMINLDEYMENFGPIFLLSILAGFEESGVTGLWEIGKKNGLPLVDAIIKYKLQNTYTKNTVIDHFGNTVIGLCIKEQYPELKEIGKLTNVPIIEKPSIIVSKEFKIGMWKKPLAGKSQKSKYTLSKAAVAAAAASASVAPAASATLKTKTPCSHGAACFRTKNPVHRAEYSHPMDITVGGAKRKRKTYKNNNTHKKRKTHKKRNTHKRKKHSKRK